MKSTAKLFLAFAVAMSTSLSSFAQITSSAISGRVMDNLGPVPGAAIVALHTPSGATYYSMSDAKGNFRLTSIQPGGPYTITVELLGYRTVALTDTYAPLAETLDLDFMLEEDALELDAAVVSADVTEAGMNIRRSGVGTSISQRTINSVPTVSRSMNDVLALTPQAATTTSGFAVGGGTYRGSSVTVDGAAFNNAFGIGSNLPAGGSPISLDAIEQMSVNITPFDVRQSGFQGGAINAVTKSGSNQFHASAYNHYTSDKVRGYRIGDNTVANNEYLNNTVGFTVGGPIIKNKLFFFVNAEYTFDTVPGTSSEARLSASDQWGGDKLYNRPTVAEMDQIKSFIGEKFGYDPGRYQGYSLKTPDYKVLARIDWNIDDNNRMNVRFSHTHTSGSNQPSSSMSPIGDTNSSFVGPYGERIAFNRYSAGRQSDYAMYFESARYFQEQNFTSVSAELNSRIFGGDGNNMVRFTWSHQDEPRSYVGDFFPTVDILSNKEMKGGSDTYAIFSTVGIDPFTYGNLRDVNTITATDEVNWSKGINNFIFGAQFEWNKIKNGYMQGGGGWFIYDSWNTFVQDVTNPSSQTLPSAFMITHANLDDPTQQTFPAFNYSQVSAYVQDELTFSDYFKITAGVRLELPIISIPTDNENKDFTAVASANRTSSFADLSTADIPSLRFAVSPRLGFNWDVLKDRSFIVRGGTGIYTGRIPNVWLVSAVGNSNVLQCQYIANAATGNPAVHFSDDRTTIINSIYSFGGKFVKQDLAAPTAATILAKNLKMPSSWKSSLALDFKLPGEFKATVEGIYSFNMNEVYATSLGIKQKGSFKLPGEPDRREIWVNEEIRNRDGARMGGFYAHNVDLHGSYYSITAQVSKSFNFGLDLMAAYTYSDARSVSDGIGDQISEFANTYQINGCNSPVLGRANYVAPSRVIADASYTIREGKHFATKLSAFYEGYNIGFVSSYSYSRVSYLMNNVSGTQAFQLIYIPTADELAKMPFVNEQNREEYAQFLGSDAYTSRHRGEYMERNGALAPWLNRVNVRIAEELNFNVAGRRQNLEVGLDIRNLGNLLNSSWGVYKQMSSNVVLDYSNDVYTFTAPIWKPFNDLASTWQMLLSVRWNF